MRPVFACSFIAFCSVLFIYSRVNIVVSFHTKGPTVVA
jgi:hypothetical protein